MRRGLLLVVALTLLAPLAAAQATPLQVPSFVHLSVTGEAATSITVTWLEPALDSGARVALTAPDGVTVEAAGEPVTGPGLGVWHTATVTGLAPATTYQYQVMGSGGAGPGPHAFTTPAGNGSFRIAALGDMGVTPQAAKTVEDILAEDPAFVLHPGDIAYAEGNEPKWHQWHQMVEPLAATRPYMTALGNHETTTGTVPDSSKAAASAGAPNSETLAYLARFTLPGNELWYSFDWNGAHIVALDTYASPFSEGSPQHAWLESDLAAAANATWRIAFLHEPLYSTNAHGPSEDVRAVFAPLFDRYGVDLVIQAHDHGYERTHALRADQVTQEGPTYTKGAGTVYIVTGGGGAELYDTWTEAPWSAAHAARYHYLLLNVSADRIEATAVPTDDGGAIDAFTLTATAPTPPAPDAGGAPAAATPLPPAALLVAVLLVAARVMGRRGS